VTALTELHNVLMEVGSTPLADQHVLADRQRPKQIPAEPAVQRRQVQPGGRQRAARPRAGTGRAAAHQRRRYRPRDPWRRWSACSSRSSCSPPSSAAWRAPAWASRCPGASPRRWGDPRGGDCPGPRQHLLGRAAGGGAAGRAQRRPTAGRRHADLGERQREGPGALPLSRDAGLWPTARVHALRGGISRRGLPASRSGIGCP
jgi:hypothetical protein